ncbi:type IV toxin-antitoxin system AbiEi family antitoxin domain-containing protein [Nocardioides sp. URHA0020]|uniref:type IV toxin-antitoxin system AbiEi family antitoxin domain-containing protein n=1 Tax=Nocardioides sp. URHA0020 TaxID=1380392 RepID=UPI0006861776|nr:type IV toxin-antitoxin system AbiEi family antitoxin domain-containing protein [Nocardioides sp. URHA0020]
MVLELITPDGLLLRRDVIRCGYRDSHLSQLMKAGHIVRIRQGAYALAATWRSLDAQGKQLLLAKAVMLQYDDGVALSHVSAAQLWGGPAYGLDLSRVHLTHFDGGGRKSAGLVHHTGGCLVGDISRRNGHWLTSPGRTVLDVTALHGVEAGVVLGDDFVHRGLTSVPEMKLLVRPMEFWPSTLTHRIMLDLIDGDSESVGETLFRLLCRRMNLPRPELQWEVRAPSGRLVGRSDFVWHDAATMGEFDGKAKYLRLRRPGESIEEAVLREKRREDEMRELTGYRMVRFVWADLLAPDRTAARLRSILRAAA